MVTPICRLCGSDVDEFLDLGMQPISQHYRRPGDTSAEYRFRLAVGRCRECTLVQQLEEVPRELMFRSDYPFLTSGSRRMTEHFARTGRELIESELTGPDPFLVEIGSNDGGVLAVVAEAGVRHVGFEPCRDVARASAARGVRVVTEFFEEASACSVAAAEGCADVVYAANTLCHIADLASVFAGLDELVAPDGIVVFEDPYLGDVVDLVSYDQIYDEHVFLFSARSVRSIADRFGFELVDVRRLPVHGGEIRYTLARAGRRTPTPAVGALIAEEDARSLAELPTLRRFADRVDASRAALVTWLHDLAESGRRVVGYAATAKSATVLNYCGIGPDLLPAIVDSTPSKHGLLTPGTHIPIRPPSAFADPYPDVALLLAWNHAEEIVGKEIEFREQGGRWLVHVPEPRYV